MRTTLRLFAKVQPGRFLEAGNPTGLTGLLTHPTPRSTLLYLYTRTLEGLTAIPEHSVYRQSTEALIKHRYKIVESFKSPGYEEWSKKAEEKVREHQDVIKNDRSRVQWAAARPGFKNDSAFVVSKPDQEEDERQVEWDGEKVTGGTLEGTRTSYERANQRFLAQEDFLTDGNEMKWEPEPLLEATQYVARVLPPLTRNLRIN